MLKFLGDMGISLRSVQFLRAQGFDAVHLHEQGLERLSDLQILEKARQERRVVLTHDLDFGDLLAASGGACDDRSAAPSQKTIFSNCLV